MPGPRTDSLNNNGRSAGQKHFTNTGRIVSVLRKGEQTMSDVVAAKTKHRRTRTSETACRRRAWAVATSALCRDIASNRTMTTNEDRVESSAERTGGRRGRIGGRRRRCRHCIDHSSPSSSRRRQRKQRRTWRRSGKVVGVVARCRCSRLTQRLRSLTHSISTLAVTQ